MGFFWFSVKQLGIPALAILIFGSIVGILDFTIINLSTEYRVYILLGVIVLVLTVIMLMACIQTVRKETGAKKLLTKYLENLSEQYDEKQKEFNLIDRTLRVGRIATSIEKTSRQSGWQFDREGALRWLKQEIAHNRHIFIKGEMGMGKTVMMLAIAKKLAEEAIMKLKNNLLSNIVIPVFIPLKESRLYSQEFLNFKKFYVNDGTLSTNELIAWITHLLTIDLKIKKELISDTQKKLLFNYLKNVFSKNKKKHFALLFDAFDEFPYKLFNGNLAPRRLFGLEDNKIVDDYWEGPVVITSRPLRLDALEEDIHKKLERKISEFKFAELSYFTVNEAKQYIQNLSSYQEEFISWYDFTDEIIKKKWQQNFGEDWRIPLYLFVLSQDFTNGPDTRKDLFESVYKHTFNWYYSKKDHPNQVFIKGYCNKQKEERTIIIKEHNKKESTFTIFPSDLFSYEKEVLKELALYLSKENKYDISIDKYEYIVRDQLNIRNIPNRNRIIFSDLLQHVLDDGNYILCPIFDRQNNRSFAFSPRKFQEAFTAMKFIELKETEQIGLLKMLLPQIEDMRETIILCWQMLKEETKDEKQVKKLFEEASPDFEFLFQIMGITPIKLLTNIILKIDVINGERRIVGIDLSYLHLKNIDVLQHLEQLQVLDLRGNQLTDLAPLAKLTHLQVLDLRGNRITDLAPLAKLTHLQVLDLKENQLTDLAPLAKLTQLQRLDLKGNQLTDLAPLAKLTQLQVLDLGWNQFTDLAALAALTQLQRLDLWRNRITDLAPLVALTQLQRLSLRVNRITDLAPLAKLTQLKGLDLWSNQLTDLAPLAKLTQLQRLYLKGNQLTELAPLAKLTQLQELDLRGNQLTDLAPLAELPQLQRLYLGGNQLTDLAPLAELPQLQKLELGGNQLTELAPLAKLPQLQELDLRGNRITELAPLAELPQLQGLYLEGNLITELDVSPFIFHKDFVYLGIDDEVQLLCKRELIDKITCPALNWIKVRIKPID